MKALVRGFVWGLGLMQAFLNATTQYPSDFDREPVIEIMDKIERLKEFAGM